MTHRMYLFSASYLINAITTHKLNKRARPMLNAVKLANWVLCHEPIGCDVDFGVCMFFKMWHANLLLLLVLICLMLCCNNVLVNNIV